ncbi:MAG: tRNA (adenosine(37)-N6)-dimethylallyltransferase MiaA [Pseudomonadota bacterium]
MALAERFGGAVVNADSQQVYAHWRVLTARPIRAEEARLPHRLFGFLPLRAQYSAGAWLRDLPTVLADCEAAGRVPIIVGGTGLYFRALTEGMAPIPSVPDAVRQEAEAMLSSQGLAAMVQDLADKDPETAAQIDVRNPARVLRAWEVLQATGKGLVAWRQVPTEPLLPLCDCVAVRIDPPREWLYRRCDLRLDEMVAGGALEEVAAADAPPDAPGMKAVGVAELSRHLQGECTLADAVTEAKTATRRYAKRQLTWARNQMPGWLAIAETDRAQRLAAVLARVENRLDPGIVSGNRALGTDEG